MLYNLAEKEEKLKAIKYFNSLIDNKKVVEIKRKAEIRTLRQNAYLHLLLSYCALTYGETKEYFKQIIWKQIICRDVFESEYTNPITKEKRVDWRSSADLTTDEMTTAIDRLIAFAAKEMNITLPRANDLTQLRDIQNTIERKSSYL